MILAGGTTLTGQNLINRETVVRVKHAAAYVKVTIGDQPRGTGSGFVFRRDGKTAWVATNQHVVGESMQDKFFGEKLDLTKRKVSVVFNSGTLEETSYDAKVLAEDIYYDLAVLRIEMSEDDLPEPVSLEPNVADLHETMPVWFFGFPFGAQLSDKENPEITVGEGKISVLRRSEASNGVSRIQLQAPLNPGNSGGPVVNHKGAVIGVAVSIMRGNNSISFAVPTVHLQRLIAGRLGNPDIKKVYNAGKKECVMTLKMDVLDPFERLKEVQALTIPRSEVSKKDILFALNDADQWEQVSEEMKTSEVVLTEGKAEIETALPGKENDKYLMQFVHTYSDGSKRFSEPGEIVLKTEEEGVNAGPHWNDGGTTPKRPDRNLNRSDAELLGKRIMKPLAKFKAFYINLDAKKLVTPLFWGPEYDYFYVVEKDGVVRKVEYAIAAEERKVELEVKPVSAAVSSTNLLVLTTDGKLLMLSPATLATEATIEVEGMAVIASPGNARAFVLSKDGKSLTAVETATKAIGEEFKASDLAGEAGDVPSDAGKLRGFESPAISPDGKYLIAWSGKSAHRFQISEEKLVYEAASPALFPDAPVIEISQDSKYFSIPSSGGNRSYAKGPKLKPGDVYILRIDSMRPSMAVATGGSTNSIHLHTKAPPMVYANNAKNQLMLITPKGKTSQALAFLGSEKTRHLMVHESATVIYITTDKSIVRLQTVR